MDLTPEQEEAKRRYDKIEIIAREAGFNEMDLAATEFVLVPFFNHIVEKCATLVEECKHSAQIIRRYSVDLGNK